MPRKDGIVRIHLAGDKDLARRLRKIRRQLPDEIDGIALDVAELLVPFVRAKIPLGPGRNGHVKYSITAKARRGAPVVDGGGPGFPYYGWLEFGGRVGIKRSVARTKIKEGRYIYPTAGQHRELIEHEMTTGLDDLMRRHGLDVV
jgi:hypothetical protein